MNCIGGLSTLFLRSKNTVGLLERITLRHVLNMGRASIGQAPGLYLLPFHRLNLNIRMASKWLLFTNNDEAMFPIKSRGSQVIR